jgi:hyperosmotically inducible protein
MNTHQLLSTAAVVLALGAGGCNRPETDAQARRAAEDVKQDVKAVAAKAGDKLADAWLTTQIQAKYFADREIKARYIDVSTHDNVVTISGYVPSDDARRHTVELAKQTNGVREVQDHLLVAVAPGKATRSSEPPAAPEAAATSGHADTAPESAGAIIDDARITTTIQAKYFLTAAVKGRNINVDTRGGVVTLKGEVGSESEREEALRLARESEGVRRVEDLLTIDAAAR